MLVNESLRGCWEMLEAGTDGWKDADGALSVLFCFLAGSLPVSIMQKIKKEEEKFLLSPPPAQISEVRSFSLAL